MSYSQAISSLSMHLAVAMALLVLASSSCSTAASLSNDEAAALLRWKASLEHQSQSLLPSWDVGSNQSYCNWTGIGCDNTSSITHIILNSVGLTGTLFSFSFSFFPHLIRFELRNNSFYGSIPAQIANLSKLYYIDFSENHFSGKVPSELGSLRNLQSLYLYENYLSGSIPQELGMLTLVWDLQLSINNLTGSIPTSIWNLTNLVRLKLGGNHLSGSIPTSIGNLTNLTTLYLFNNHLSGPIPHPLGNLNSLTELTLFTNKLSGSIPSELANLTHLQRFSVADNKLTGRLPENLCLDGSLISLGVSYNNLTGHIPKSLRNCNSLIRVRLEHNRLEGNLQEEFGVLPSLDYMDLSYNRFRGKLSETWGQSRNLTKLVISNNQLTGNIPPVLATATKLQFLDLSSNNLVGEIPKNLRELGLLFHLNLSNNKLSGNIPAEILGSLSRLQNLDLAANNLTGSIPREIANCENLQNLNLGENRLAGGIPFELEKLKSLQSLDLGDNNLMGEIPSQLGKMPRLEKLNLSHNTLSGSIPSSFGEKPTSLQSIDISYNNLKGPLPNTKAFEDIPYEAYRGNDDLCGNQTRLIPCSSPIVRKNADKSRTKTKLVLLVVVPLVGTLFLLLVVVGIFQFLSKRVVLKAESEIQVVHNKNLFEIWSYDGKIVYENIIEATEDFNEKYCIGRGGYGTVYKATLSSALVVAVKKTHPSQDGNLVDLKSFRSEIHALTEARHRNIIKLYGFCSDSCHSFLVYEFLEGGSLENKLKNEKEALRFDWGKRMNAITGVVSGLCYLHHECSHSIIHRDISSKNILFDSKCVAHISDFGHALSGVVKFDPRTGQQFKSKSPTLTYTQYFAESLIKEAEADNKIVAIHAAMGGGTGLNYFQKKFPDRCFDVGIAEQHAVTFAAGLATEGLKPFCAIYSSFLQRGYDQVVHDVDLQKLPVRFAMDRAGLVGADGPTHCGAFDITYMACLPNMVVMAPSDEAELMHMVATAAAIDDRPSCFRFPRGNGIGVALPHNNKGTPIEIGKGRILMEGNRVAILGYGTIVQQCVEASGLLKSQNISVTVADARFCKPLDADLIKKLAKEHEILITVEEGSIGGFGSHVSHFLSLNGILDGPLKLRAMVLPDRYIDHGSPQDQVEAAGLSARHISATVLSLLGRPKEALKFK